MKLEAKFASGSAGESSGEKVITCTEYRLSTLHEKIIKWDSDQSMIWTRAPEESSEFLKVIDELHRYTSELPEEEEELLCHTHSILQLAMAKIEEEFLHLLIEYQQPFEPDRMSFRSTEEDPTDDFSSGYFEEEQIQGKLKIDSARSSSGEFIVDMIHPDAVFELRSIAQRMFLSNYDKECCQAYINARREALDECLCILRMERLSIEEVIQMDWRALNVLIKRWNRAVKVFVRVYLVSERRLCDLIFGDLSESVRNYCFLESSKVHVLLLLNIGEAIAIGPMEVEKLFRVLDMHQCLTDLLVDIEGLYPEEIGSLIMIECHEVILRLSKSIKGIFSEFKKRIKNNISNTPYPGGGVHHITKYVMNYLKALSDYMDTLDLLLRGNEVESVSSPLVHHVHSITLILETNLEAKSRLYTDNALRHLFMMNNLCYMVQKMKDSDIQAIFGNDWAKNYNRKFGMHAMNYERATWNPVLGYLREEGMSTNSSSLGLSSRGRAIIRDKFKGFNVAFEEVYRTQTGWNVPNIELRDDLKISISLKVLQAYRPFVGRYQNLLDARRHRDSYIKYCPEDLERCLLDLFEGSPKVMHSYRR